MNEINDGGQAFPQNKLCPPVIGAYPVFEQVGGMSLRDWFAGQAAAGMMADPAFRGDDFAQVCAEQAYQVADAMLAERTTKEAGNGNL